MSFSFSRLIRHSSVCQQVYIEMYYSPARKTPVYYMAVFTMSTITLYVYVCTRGWVMVELH